jgi:divalent metal cation (Fe/Co/Zn/Cd) transporter
MAAPSGLTAAARVERGPLDRRAGSKMEQLVSLSAETAAQKRAGGLRRAIRLETFSLAYNLLEAVVGLAAGLAAGSVALVGFALDSVVESSSASVLLWRLHSEARGRRTAEQVEKRTVRLVALAFFALAAYVAVQAFIEIAGSERAEESPVGVALAVTSVIVMPVLAARKRAAARELNSRSLQADSRQTSLCTYLSAVLLAGLLANAWFGWWWADPVAALAIAGVAAREGFELWRTDDFCCL